MREYCAAITLNGYNIIEITDKIKQSSNERCNHSRAGFAVNQDGHYAYAKKRVREVVLKCTLSFSASQLVVGDIARQHPPFHLECSTAE